uniref:Papain-like cysteine prorease n=1 Tax=Plasmodium malariae TaxID=5858 RepID=F1SYS8_PLAMA|nr:putative papain-like cysteine prorease [Plasmodium malariae]
MIFRSCFLLIICVIYSKNITNCVAETTVNSDTGGPHGSGIGEQGLSSSSSENVTGESHSPPGTSVGTSSDNDQSSSSSVTAGNTGDVGQTSEASSKVPEVPSKPSPHLNTNPQQPNREAPQAVQSDGQNVEQGIQVTSTFLKNFDGIKVTGSCKAYFRVFFVPHIWIYVDPTKDSIELKQLFEPVRTVNITQLRNKCINKSNSTFKFIAYVKDQILTLKWLVIGEGADAGNKVDVKKYKIPVLDKTFSSVQVHTANAEKNLIESKNYHISSVIPDQCSIITTNCFLSGSLDIEHCFHCTLLAQKYESENECFKYVSEEAKERIAMDIPTIAQDEEYSVEYRLIESIDIILKSIYKTDENGGKKEELINFEDLENDLKSELKNYCALLKEMDESGTLKNFELANEEETFNNLSRLLKVHPNENMATLRLKFRNPAICVKNVDEWIVNKRGLTLHNETYSAEKVSHDQANADSGAADKGRAESDTTTRGASDSGSADELMAENFEEEEIVSDDIFEKDSSGIIDLSKMKTEMNFKSPYYQKSKYCNKDYCDRWKDKTSCISNIEVEEQGDCGLCWIFASKLHVETIRCMRGYGHFRSSALFVANCSSRNPEEICIVGSNPTEFLQIVNDNKFLPLESDLPYSYNDAGNACPTKRNKWTNLWGNTKLLLHKRDYSFLNTLGYIAYESINFKDKMELFINIIKQEIQNKGSVIVYVKTNNVIDYDFNGKVVHSICGDNEADHAANIIGYGNYINIKGEKRSYWLVRNSWGYYWGDEGNFKVDMYGHDECLYNFIHTAVVFKIDLDMVEVPKKNNNNNNNSVYNYFHKYVPDFFYNLFYVNYDKDKDKDKGESFLYDNGNREEIQQNYSKDSIVSGQTEPESAKVIPAPQPTKSAEKIFKVLHILKNIKDGKIKRGFVKYENLKETENPYSCSRIYSKDPNKMDECKQFCFKEWSKCEKHYSPGYCLTKLYSGDNCFFCNI